MVQAVVHNTFDFSVGGLTAPAVSVATLRIDASRLQGCRIKKWKAQMSFDGKTDGEGIFIVGFSHGLTNTEILEALQADPQGENDIPAMEEANRPIYPMWVIAKDGVETFRDNHRAFEEVKYPWKTIPEGVDLQLWCFASSDDLTTGMFIRTAHVWVTEWLRD